MKKEELRKKLNKLGIHPSSYNLNERSIIGDEFVVRKNGDKWEVFYSERDKKLETQQFNTESEAYNYLYKRFVEEEQIIKNSRAGLYLKKP